MAKKDAYYFPHDSNAKDDPKCSMLIESLGLEGYGIYWVLIENLRDQPDYRYPFVLIPSIARKYNTTVDKVKAVVTVYGLFEYDENSFFFSNSLIERMLPLEEKREKNRMAGKISAKRRKQNINTCSTHAQHMFNTCSTDVEHMLNTCSTHVQPIEEIKGENIKTFNTADKSAQKTIGERKEEFKSKVRDIGNEIGIDDKMKKSFFDYWSEHNENGKKMLFEMKQTFNVKSRLVTWREKSSTVYQNKQDQEDVKVSTKTKFYAG